MWFQRKTILSFDETSLRALAIAKRLCVQEGAAKVNDLHFLKGVIHCGDARAGAVFAQLDFNYNDEIAKADNVKEELVEKSLAPTTSYTNEVKKILARGNRHAQKKNKKEIAVLDLLIGIVEESPALVSAALKERNLSLPQIGKMIA